MDNKNIQSILQDALEEEIPSSQVELWPAMKASLVAGKHPLIQQGEKMKSTKPRRLSRAAFAALMIIVLLVIAFTTPQGRAFAQDILRFFVRAESDTRPVPTLAPVIKVVTPNTSNWVSPTPLLDVRQPFQDTCGSLLLPHCSLAEIRKMVTFPIKGLTITLNGIEFVGATGGPEKVSLTYAGKGLNGTLLLAEEPADSHKQQAWQVAASAAVESVSVDGAAGEYVQGGWFSVDANNGVAWNADASVQTMRWEADGILYTMVFHAAKMDTGILLDKPALLDLAAHLTAETSGNSSPEPTVSPTIKQISQLAGFTVVEPTWVPEGYIFLDATYTPQYNAVCLYYGYRKGGSSPLLAIVEGRPATASPTLDDITNQHVLFEGKDVNVPIDTESLTVGGADNDQAILVSNGVDAGKLCKDKNLIANRALFWQSNGKKFVIFGLLDQYEGGVFVSRLELRSMAEGLTGVSTIPNDKLDPERLHSVEDAETLAGFDIKAPTRMLAGVQFDHAAYLDNSQSQEVKLVYTPGNPTRGGIDYGFFISQATGSIRSLDEVYGWGGYEYVSINGQPALYRKICWDVIGGGTDCYQELSWDENHVGYDIKAYFPGAMDKQEFFGIAESLR